MEPCRVLPGVLDVRQIFAADASSPRSANPDRWSRAIPTPAMHAAITSPIIPHAAVFKVTNSWRSRPSSPSPYRRPHKYRSIHAQGWGPRGSGPTTERGFRALAPSTNYKVDRKNQTTSITYDGINRPKLVTFQDASTITITWDAGNRPTKFVDSVNGTISRVYDGLDRLTQETTPQGVISYTYDAASRRQTMTVTGQPVINYTFDNDNRLTQVAQGTNVLSFGYDAAGRRTTITLPNSIIGTFGFDNANQLTSISYMHGATTVGTLGYGYDLGGRRTSMTGTLAGFVPPTAAPSLTYDGTNRLSSWGGKAITYDANGNITNFGLATYTWNARNQLTATSGGSATFSYDSLGRRVSATVTGVTTPYLYDGQNPAMISSNQMLAGSGLDEIYAQINSSGTTSYLRDGLNSTVAVTNSSAATTANYSYSPYGESASTGTASTPLQFTGRENDGATGLYYYRARYYSPQLGRFIAEDPIGMAGGANFYTYVAGNPESLIDPLGLCAANPTSAHCFGEAARAKGLSIGLDVLGAIPIFGNVASATSSVARGVIAIDHAINKPAVGLASGVVGEYGAVTGGPDEVKDSVVGGVSASAGIALVLADLSLEGTTKALPGIGNVVSGLTALWDIGYAYNIYESCMAGH
jgi:RHS repeat-associated protein